MGFFGIFDGLDALFSCNNEEDLRRADNEGSIEELFLTPLPPPPPQYEVHTAPVNQQDTRDEEYQEDQEERMSAASSKALVQLKAMEDTDEEPESKDRAQVDAELLAQAYRALDFNRNGTLEPGELRLATQCVQGISDHGSGKYWQKLLEAVDNKDLGVDESRFVERGVPLLDPWANDDQEVIKMRRMLLEVVKVRLAFEVTDSNQDGWVCENDLSTTITILSRTEMSPETARKGLDAIVKTPGQNLDYQTFVRTVARGGFKTSKLFKVLTIQNMAALPTLNDSVVDAEELRKSTDKMGLRDSMLVTALSKRTSNRFVGGDDMHHLGKRQKSLFSRLIWEAILFGGLLGAVSALTAWYFETRVFPATMLAKNPNRELGVNIGFASVVTVIEISIVLLNSIRTANLLAAVAGLRLYPVTPERKFLSAGLMRAAMELGHPAEYQYGVDPRKRQYWLFKVLYTIAYKAKRGCSKIVIKLFFRKVLLRTALKCLPIDFVDVPVNALWNMLTVRKQLNDVRVVTLGPACVKHVTTSLVASRKRRLDARTRVQLLRAVADAVTMDMSFHPNQFLLMAHLKSTLITSEVLIEMKDLRVGDKSKEGEQGAQATSPVDLEDPESDPFAELVPLRLDENDVFHAELARQSEKERMLTVKILILAMFLNGHLTKRKTGEIKKVAATCSLQVDMAKVKMMALAFRRGRGFYAVDLDAAVLPLTEDANFKPETCLDAGCERAHSFLEAASSWL